MAVPTWAVLRGSGPLAAEFSTAHWEDEIGGEDEQRAVLSAGVGEVEAPRRDATEPRESAVSRPRTQQGGWAYVDRDDQAEP